MDEINWPYSFVLDGDYAFTARLSQDQIYDNTPVIFDTVVNNYGGGYSELSGFFTAFGTHFTGFKGRHKKSGKFPTFTM